jgi:hypothetical protein
MATIINVWGKHCDDIEFGTSGQDEFSMIPHYFREFNNNPYVIVIYAGLTSGAGGTNFNNVTIASLRKYLISVSKPDSLIMFDNLHEGNVTPWIDIIYRALEGTQIRPDQVYYFSAALDDEIWLTEYCTERDITDKINMYSCNAWEHHMFKTGEEFTRDIVYQPKVRQKTFLCMNRVLRAHRLALVNLLIEKNLVKDSFYSFFPTASHSASNPMSWVLPILSNNLSHAMFDKIMCLHRDNMTKFPLKLNIEAADNKNYINSDDLALFDESYFSLVTETYFFITSPKDEQAIFFTEKIFKPILMKHPFLIVSRPHSLQHLRELQFKTFAPYIDEAYDAIEDSEQRMLAIVNEVERLSKFTPEQWIDWQNNVKPIVDHNYMIMTNRPKVEYVRSRSNKRTRPLSKNKEIE